MDAENQMRTEELKNKVNRLKYVNILQENFILLQILRFF